MGDWGSSVPSCLWMGVIDSAPIPARASNILVRGVLLVVCVSFGRGVVFLLHLVLIDSAPIPAPAPNIFVRGVLLVVCASFGRGVVFLLHLLLFDYVSNPLPRENPKNQKIFAMDCTPNIFAHGVLGGLGSFLYLARITYVPKTMSAKKPKKQNYLRLTAYLLILHLQKALCSLMYVVIFLTCASACPHLDVQPRLAPAFLHGVRPGALPRTIALLPHSLETVSEKVAVRRHAITTKVFCDQLSRERALPMNPPTQDYPMVGAHYQYSWAVSFPINPSTQPNFASPPSSAPVSPLSTNRHLSLLVLVHHLLEETSRINNKAFRNIGFHTTQVVSRRLGVNRKIRPRWSFVKPCTCSTPRTPSRSPTASSGGRYARGPCGSGGTHGPQSAAGSTQPSQPRNVDPLKSSGDSQKPVQRLVEVTNNSGSRTPPLYLPFLSTSSR